jgi:hypothetical protein
VQLLTAELNNASVKYILKAKAMSFYFDLHVAEVVEVYDTTCLFDKMHRTLKRIKPISSASFAVPCGSQTFSVLTEKIRILLALYCWFSFSEI